MRKISGNHPNEVTKYYLEISPLAQIAILIGLTGMGLILGSLISCFFLFSSVGGSTSVRQMLLTNKIDPGLLKLIQLLSTFFIFFVPALIFATIVGHRPFTFLGMKWKKTNLKIFLFVLLIVILSLPLSGALSSLNEIIPLPKNMAAHFHQMESQYDDQVLSLAVMKTWKDYLSSLLVIALIPALFEETFFRGCFQQLMVQWTKSASWGILISSIVFSAVHMSFYGFLPRMALGILLGIVFNYGKNLWLNVLLHFLNNAFALTQIYILYKTHGSISSASMNDTNYPIWIGLIAIVALYFVIKRYILLQKKLLNV